eukprot:6144919-Pleurochrysis_carterae.AAC.1
MGCMRGRTTCSQVQPFNAQDIPLPDETQFRASSAASHALSLWVQNEAARSNDARCSRVSDTCAHAPTQKGRRARTAHRGVQRARAACAHESMRTHSRRAPGYT